MEPLISVIVPVYNVERYIAKCVQSIVKQDYSNLEILLIDDGSTDESGVICDRWVEKDTRIRVIHKTNGGVSSARNLGILESKGELICFVDADDWLPNDAFSKLFYAISQNNVDISFGSIEIKAPIRDYYLRQKDLRIEKETQTEEWLEFISDEAMGSPWAKLFKSRILKEHKVFFPENIKRSEDAIFVFSYLKFCKTAATTSGVVYIYNRFNNSSASLKFFPEFNQWQAEAVSAFTLLCQEMTGRFVDVIRIVIIKRYLNYSLGLYFQTINERDKAISLMEESYQMMLPYFPENFSFISLSYDDPLYILSQEDGASMLYQKMMEKQVVKPRWGIGIRHIIERAKEFFYYPRSSF